MQDSLSQTGHVVGLKQTSRALRENRVRTVYLASDCDDNIKAQVRSLCRDGKVPCVEEYTMEVLGRSCGIDVGASVVGVV